MKTVNTLRGKRMIDTSAKLVENNEGQMVEYTRVEVRHIDGQRYFLYVHVGDKSATALTETSHKDLVQLSDEQKAKNIKAQNIARLMSEGYEAC